MSSEPSSTRRPFRFVALTLVALAALAFVAAHAPARLKLLGLFPVVIGAATGLIVCAIGLRNGVAGRWTVAVAAVSVPLVLAGYAGESFRIWRQARADEVASNLLAQPGGKAVLDQIRSGKKPANKVEAEFFAAYRERMSPPFAAYLADRFRGLPMKVSPTGAATVAATEFAFGWAAGIVAAVLVVRRRDRP